MSSGRVTLHGQTFELERIPDADAFEFECLMAWLLAPALSVVVGAGVETFAAEVMALLRAVALPAEVEEGSPRFDFARLAPLLKLDVETTDPRLELLLEALGERLPAMVGSVGAQAVPELTDRAVDHTKVKRLAELAIIGRVTWVPNDKPGGLKFTSWELFTKFSRRDPRWKYRLLAAQWTHHWSEPEALP